MPNQPRTYFDQSALKELAESIGMLGQNTPIVVIEKHEGDTKYQLIDGQRRWHACEIAKVDMMQVIIANIENPDDQFVSSLTSNCCREGHTIVETANNIQRLTVMGKTLEEIQKIFGHSSNWVLQHQSILQLHPEVQKLLEPENPEEQRITFGTAQLLVGVPEQIQIELAKTISSSGLSTSEARILIKRRYQRTERRERLDEDFNMLLGRIQRENKYLLNLFADTNNTLLKKILCSTRLQRRMALIEELEKYHQFAFRLFRLVKKIEQARTGRE
jgi:ParB family chromosome partitioning protein